MTARRPVEPLSEGSGMLVPDKEVRRMGLELMEFPSVPAAFQRYTETNLAGTNNPGGD
jgi:hypothetical protein|eukprot:SAG25_NODE_2784_length_1385_cov_0.985226_1_plen_58_part_00